jgi:predicted ester cyclase
MAGYRALCWTVIICGALTVTSGQPIKSWGEEESLAPVTELSPEMQAERNRVPVRQLYEDMFTHGRYELIGQVFARQCPVHFGSRNVRLEQAVAEGKGWRSAAPDLVMTINEITVNREMVTVVWTAKGTHTGRGNGLKPTGRRISMRSTSRFRVVNGKIVEAWNEEYKPELYRQLGVSKTAAYMFETAYGLLSSISVTLPERVGAFLQ